MALPFPFTDIARSLIDNGADLVVGSHSHAFRAEKGIRTDILYMALAILSCHGILYKWNLWFPNCRIEMVFEGTLRQGWQGLF